MATPPLSSASLPKTPSPHTFRGDDNMIAYLSQAGPLHPKHGGGDGGDGDGSKTTVPHREESKIISPPPHHPTLAFLVHYAVAVPSIFYAHDSFFLTDDPGGDFDAARRHDDEAEEASVRRRQAIVSRFLLAYCVVLFSTRYLSSHRAGRLRRHSVLYELTWLCNSTLVMGAMTLGGLGGFADSAAGGGRPDDETGGWPFRRRPLVATACTVAVSIDQVLWYVDLVGWTATGTFPVGVMKYLTWEQTLWIDRFTCTHHLWTMPLLLYGASNDAELNWDSFALSAYVVFVHVSLSRWLTPRCVRSRSGADTTNASHVAGGGGKVDDEKDEDPRRYRYLNVNLSHELWRDISFSFLQISIDDPPCWIYLFRLLWRWQLFNGLVFVAILRPLSRLMAALHGE